MARSLRIEFPGAFYHVLSIGNEKKSIFREAEDYKYFLSLLKLFCKKFNALIHSYCLMDNHFHLFLETKEANLSTFMRRLLSSYSIRFNSKYNRLGHLFHGRYKAILVDSDNYCIELSRYIHLNPCKAGIINLPENYRWSSMQYFMNGRKLEFLETSLILNRFKNIESYRKFILEGLDNSKDLLEKAVGGVISGSKEFINKVKEFSHLSFNISRKTGLEGSGLVCGPN